MSSSHDLKAYLDAQVRHYEQPAFIIDDPISIPYAFDDPLDREVIGFYAALLAWGRRATILQKLGDLCERMRYRPYAFVRDFSAADVECLAGFKHRTFTAEDALWLTRCLSALLKQHGSLQAAFSAHLDASAEHAGTALEGFSRELLTAVPDVPARLYKHVARPSTGSACKRLNMYLRWMVRTGPIDFGLWEKPRADQLLLPLDVHSGRTARALGLLRRSVDDWAACLELTAACRSLCPEDPARYDFALFGIGVSGASLDARFEVTRGEGTTTSPTSR